MRSIVRGIVALFAAFLMMDAVQAAPTIVSPADYATVKTLTDKMKNLIEPLDTDVSIFNVKSTESTPNAKREAYGDEYTYSNSVPVKLSWSGTTGNCTVKVWRTNGGSESAPFFSETVSGTSTECYNLEVGCNYTWKVSDSQGNSAVGHFFTEDQAPRIIRGRRSNFIYSRGSDCSNGRDIGGWATTNGKRVKQGKIYRSGQLEYCSFKEGSGIYQKMDMLYDVLGIRVDIDLRTVENVNYYADWKAEWDTGSDNVCEWSGIGPDVERFTIEWETLGKGPSDGNPFVYDGKYGCQFPSYSAFYSNSTISKKSGSTVLYSYTQTAAQNKIAVWAAFNRIHQAVVVDKEPVIFHCSHGKDRTGSLALVIHGLLGVSEADIKRDFATAWFCNEDYTFTQTSMDNMITELKKLDTASTKTLAGGCEKYLISCATAAGDNAGATKVAAFKTAMLEEPETAAAAPLDDIGTAEEGDWGYRKTIGNEVAIVFTNHTKTVTWTVPENLENVKFLVVGGGGGGGEDSDVGNTHGGAGGGGGGVVTGLVDFAENSVVTITVGAGGNGGVRATQGGTNNKYGAAFSGEASSINVDGAEYVWAAGGGGDNGADESTNASKTKGNVGNDGGSSAGSRPGQTGCGAVIAPRVASVSDIKYADKSFGRQGGAGYYVTPADDSNTYWGYFSAAGGGGGATQAGGSAVDYTNAGNGGEGLLSSITGQAVVYGSGGGGATLDGTNGGKGGTGAGDGNTADVVNGTASMDALPNQGGGGGGGARAINKNSSGVGVGGNGGSGIVVLRYTTASVDPEEPVLTAVVAPTAVANLVYTGSELTGVVASEGYTLADNTATDAGTYEATATLAEGYKWSDGSTDEKKISWSIGKAENAWTTEPSISLETWTQGETAGVLTPGVAKFGEVTSSMAEFPTEVGSYTITYTVAEDKNYTGLNATVQFEIKAPEVVEPEEPGDDPVSQIPTIPAEWGYVKTDLGDLHNEVAVVFTNHVDKAMSWTVPADIENVQFLVVGGGGGGGGCIRRGSNYVKNDDEGGAGGGGGGVVTGLVKFNKGDVVSVAVGIGGTGGTGAKNTSTAGSGAGTKGDESNFYVGENLYIKAFGGGGDGGYEKSGSVGGSSAGCRPNKNSASRSEDSIGTKGANATAYLSDVVFRGNTGGAGYTSCTSGGGGGATAAGSQPGSSGYGGAGGAGLTLSIADDLAVTYGSGGGGGSARTDGHGGQGGEGAGNGGVFDENAGLNGASGTPNQGGGGGGGSFNEGVSTTTFGNGGNGGSGIVVFRYTLKSEVKVDAAEYIESKLTDKVYTGSLLTSGLTEDEAYTVSEEGGINVGEYIVSVTLKDGFVWADGNTSSTTNFTWKITKNANEWATVPLLSVNSWAQDYASNVKFVAPVQTVGELNATITKDGVTETFSGTLPTEPGDYTINYSVTETDNYAGRTWGASFKIYRSEPFDGGYKVFGLGEDGNEEAMVFTQSGSWNIDKNLKNVQFLVVGGGGGGGADNSKTSDQRQAGSGGGGGGVVTGLVNFVAGQTVAITVGAGGQGGERGGSTSPYGAVKTQAENSSFAIGTATSVVAFAGGGDTGSINNSSDSTGGQTGGNGGSSAGSRATATGRGEATCGSVNDTANAIICSNTLGNKGGAGAAQYQAGGGGGATTEGEDGTENAGGNGGEGYATDINGTDLVYGSGGGGGAVAGGAQGPGLGGSGAGNGGHVENATSAMPNQGGGGGGGGRVGNGGNGGSGIVVFRYVVAPESPSVDGTDYDADKVFDAAKVSKPITYPGNPEVTTNTVDGVVTITFGGVPAQVPAYYNVTKVEGNGGYQIVLAIKDEFKNPVIANSENEDGSITPAIKVEGGKVTIHLEGDQFSKELYYIFKKGGDLTARGAWEVCNMTTETGDVQFDLNANDTAGFFEFIKVSDERITE